MCRRVAAFLDAVLTCRGIWRDGPRPLGSTRACRSTAESSCRPTSSMTG